ncbi:hypothetical protein ACGF5C_29365 [Micromonospora sp. NPDC047620]|uniref:hypothetical protein n=1 Tax=Micromonospora sp. NPDC047620 TaxID=3364251 RepID=UPI00371043C0
MPDLDFAGLDRAVQAAFRPDFTEVRRRAARRRRHTRVAAASLTTLALFAVAGVASARRHRADPQVSVPGLGGTPTPGFIPTPAPSTSPVPGEARTPRPGPVVAGDLDHFYFRWKNCREDDCVLVVSGTADRGATWRSRELPLPHNALVALATAGQRTLIASYQVDVGAGRPVSSPTTGR